MLGRSLPYTDLIYNLDCGAADNYIHAVQAAYGHSWRTPSGRSLRLIPKAAIRLRILDQVREYAAGPLEPELDGLDARSRSARTHAGHDAGGVQSTVGSGPAARGGTTAPTSR